MRILAVGTITFDAIGWTDAEFHDDALTVPLTSLTISHGGRGANFAAVVAALGRKVRLVSSVGTDFATSAYHAELRSREVDLSGLFHPADCMVTPHVFLFNNAHGTRVYQYRDRRAEAEQGLSAWSGQQAGSWPHELLYCTSEVPEVNRAALRCSPAPLKIFAPGHDLRGYSSGCLQECLARTDILIVNSAEFGFLERGDSLPAHGAGRPGVIVVTHGADGSSIHQTSSTEQLPACPPKKVVDPTGAGDAFAGGFAHHILDQRDPVQAARTGSVVASFVIEAAGCQSGIPTANQVMRRGEDVYPKTIGPVSSTE